MKVKFTNKYETYKRKEGIYGEGISMTDKSQAEEADIYKCIEKYGIATMMRQSMAQEPIYLDNTKKMTLQEAVNMRKYMDEYFEQLPARCRKVFGDDPETFYQKYKSGDFNDFLNTGVMTEEQINAVRLAGGENEINFEEMATANNINTSDNKSNMANIQNAGGSIQPSQSGEN